MVRLFVGNIPYECSENGLMQWFEERGHQVDSCRIIGDPETGRSKGYGFVELTGDLKANEIILLLKGQKMGDRELSIGLPLPKKTFVPRNDWRQSGRTSGRQF